MRAGHPHTPIPVADRDRQPHDGDTIADALRGDPVPVEQLIAHVLRRAHRTAEALRAPNEARAILHVAQSFADELAAGDPSFDRLRFVQTATDGPS